METAFILLSDARFRSALESSRDVVLALDLDGQIQSMNVAGMELFGVSAPRAANLRSLVPHPMRYSVRAALAEARKNGVANFELELVSQTSAPRWWGVNMVRVVAKDEPDSLFAIMRDITTIKLTSQAAVAQLPEVTATAVVLRSALRLAQLDAWRYDHIRKRVAFTPELRDSLSQSAQDQSLEEALKIWIEEDGALFQQELERAAETASDMHFEGQIRTPDGELRWLRVLGEPEVLNGRCIAMRGASQDITEERSVMARLQASEESALKAASAMSGFLATMSHEIRTPLNGVLGMAQAMAMGDLPDKQREHLRVIRASGESLLVLLNDLLDLSKIEAGRIEIEKGLINPQTLVDSALAFDSILKAKGVQFNIVLAPDARGLWAGDVTRVRQILSNLVSNASKFTEKGMVCVDLCSKNGDFIIRVKDSGIGIAADKLADVFNKFTQADSSTTRRFGGTGLGLAICQQLAGLMGGEITVESVPGEGATFTARLPLQHVETTEPDRADAQEIREETFEDAQLRVLAAEDNPTNQLVLRTLLSAIGIEPVIVSNGQEAVDAWRTDRWDIVLMDVQMPVKDGIQAVTEIRALERREGRDRTPVIALTANAMTHHETEYLSAGMDALVAKPIELSSLMGAMNALLLGEA